MKSLRGNAPEYATIASFRSHLRRFSRPAGALVPTVSERPRSSSFCPHHLAAPGAPNQGQDHGGRMIQSRRNRREQIVRSVDRSASRRFRKTADGLISALASVAFLNAQMIVRPDQFPRPWAPQRFGGHRATPASLRAATPDAANCLALRSVDWDLCGVNGLAETTLRERLRFRAFLWLTLRVLWLARRRRVAAAAVEKFRTQ